MTVLVDDLVVGAARARGPIRRGVAADDPGTGEPVELVALEFEQGVLVVEAGGLVTLRIGDAERQRHLGRLSGVSLDVFGGVVGELGSTEVLVVRVDATVDEGDNDEGLLLEGIQGAGCLLRLGQSAARLVDPHPGAVRPVAGVVLGEPAIPGRRRWHRGRLGVDDGRGESDKASR
jgi:hypothetical protein